MNAHKFGSPTYTLVSIGAAVCLLAGSYTVQASELEGTGIRISGFGTLGVVQSEAPEGWGFLRNLEQPPSTRSTRFDIDSRLGVQLNYAASSQIELVGQFLATRRGPEAALSDAVEWAFAACRPNADLAIRAGRLNLDQFVMSDYRNVGFAYLYARPPVEFYGVIPSNLDGTDVSQTWHFDDVRWRAKGFLGRSKSVAIALDKVFGVALTRESDGLLLRAGWSRAKFAHNSPALTPLFEGLDQIRALPVPTVAAEAVKIRNDLDLAAEPLVYATLGLTYEHGQWQYAAEITRPSVGKANIRAGYASVGRRIGKLTLFGMVSSGNSDLSALATPAWDALLTPLIGPASAAQAQMLGAVAADAANQSIRQTTYSLGGRWDIHPRVAFKAQWDYVKVKANGGYLWSSATSDPASATIATVLLVRAVCKPAVLADAERGRGLVHGAQPQLSKR